MLECMIVGDSIGVGIANYRPECYKMAYTGINSKTWRLLYANEMSESKTAIISLGSNDHAKIGTADELTQIRQSVKAEKVLWILPSKRFLNARDAVLQVAKANHDIILEIPVMSADGVHPTGRGYKKLSEMTK